MERYFYRPSKETPRSSLKYGLIPLAIKDGMTFIEVSEEKATLKAEYQYDKSETQGVYDVVAIIDVEAAKEGKRQWKSIPPVRVYLPKHI